MQFHLSQLTLSPGSEICLSGIDWAQFERFAEQAGRPGRLSYSEGELTIMSPSVEHEYDKSLLGNLVEILLDSLEMDFVPLGSVTLKHPVHGKGVEPDECYYITHASQIRGKSKLDMSIDPPPDVVMEIDITSHKQWIQHTFQTG